MGLWLPEAPEPDAAGRLEVLPEELPTLLRVVLPEVDALLPDEAAGLLEPLDTLPELFVVCVPEERTRLVTEDGVDDEAGRLDDEDDTEDAELLEVEDLTVDAGRVEDVEEVLEDGLDEPEDTTALADDFVEADLPVEAEDDEMGVGRDEVEAGVPAEDLVWEDTEERVC